MTGVQTCALPILVLAANSLHGIDPVDHRMKFRDYVGHVVSWDGYTLEMVRDAAANGSRPAQNVTIHQEQIATLKPVPERRNTPPRP